MAMMTEAVNTSETSVSIYQTTLCYIPENSHLHTLSSENLKYHQTANLMNKDTGPANNNLSAGTAQSTQQPLMLAVERGLL
jgi:hypothetical protein